VRVAVAVAALFLCYLPVALYLKHTYVEHGPPGLMPLHIYPSAHKGVYASPLWMPNDCGQATVYQHGSPIARTNRVVEHPNRSYSVAGQRWKVIEFNLSHEPAGRAYHGRPC
jgi:hypothetical protein